LIPSTEDLMLAVAASGLAGRRRPFLAEPLPKQEFLRLVSKLEAGRLQGHLASAVESGLLPVTDEQREIAAVSHARAMAACLRLEELLVSVIDAFGAAGIDHRVLKGSAAAHLDYVEGSERCYGDVDLLVRSSQFDEAVAVLGGLGHRRRFPQPRPGFDRQFTKSVTMTNQLGLEVDLHRTLAEGPFGMRIGLTRLWATSEEFSVGGRRLAALARDERLLHACYHAALGDPEPRLVALRDIATMLERADPERVERVLAIADEWRGHAVVARALRLTSERLGVRGDALMVWATQHVPSRRDRVALSVYVGSRGSYATRAVAAVGAVPGVRAKVAYVRALGFPELDYVHARHVSRWARIRSLLARGTGSTELRSRR